MEGFIGPIIPHLGSISGKAWPSISDGHHLQVRIPIRTTPSRSWNRRLDHGMRISTSHPEGVSEVATSQNVFQLSFTGISSFNICASPKTVWSTRIPAGVVMNTSAFSLSSKVSMTSANSSSDSVARSRASDRAVGEGLSKRPDAYRKSWS